ncbi:glycosyltransferase family 2 protein [Planktothrix sp. FACHB-1365]|uniref:glycosyltransferase family 2 protein n=1 Tax=Planktothrix sp. FACHB-1365 TaxID=2692855 RepID=UPI0016821C2C|nr:glycosyltransferase family 2 protein [Planktothrix sp. FACHB-1365]MBD2482369.1 glycosyltransferase family 2 protein [Planktothrix sp. FACHB-1365]
MQKLPLVSILVNNYNYGHFLAEAINSALNQTYSPIEVIVVDDGSTDNSRSIIESYEQKIIPILKENGGQATAFNVGFAASRGDIICFLDADDLFEPHKIEKIVQIFEQHSEVGWCFHPLTYIGDQIDAEALKTKTGAEGIYDLRESIKQGKLNGKLPFGTATSAICFKRELLEKILPMPVAIRITSDDYIKYLALGLKPGFILLQKLAIQRIHGNNAFTFKTDTDKVNLRISIVCLTAYWIKTNFPEFQKFSNNMLALAIILSLRYRNKNEENNQLIKDYLASIPIITKMEIYLRATYYLLKL